MKRSVLVLFLLLASLTLAPRTAFNPVEPEEGEAVAQVLLPDHRVRVGSAAPIVVRITNAGAPIEPEFLLDTDGTESRILMASPGCTIDGRVVKCREVGEDDQRIIRLTVRVLDLGEHWVEFKTPASGPLGSFVVVPRGKPSADR